MTDIEYLQERVDRFTKVRKDKEEEYILLRAKIHKKTDELAAMERSARSLDRVIEDTYTLERTARTRLAAENGGDGLTTDERLLRDIQKRVKERDESRAVKKITVLTYNTPLPVDNQAIYPYGEGCSDPSEHVSHTWELAFTGETPVPMHCKGRRMRP